MERQNRFPPAEFCSVVSRRWSDAPTWAWNRLKPPSVVHLAPETGGKCTTDEYGFGSTVDPWRQGFSNRKLLENFTDVLGTQVGGRLARLGPERQKRFPPRSLFLSFLDVGAGATEHIPAGRNLFPTLQSAAGQTAGQIPAGRKKYCRFRGSLLFVTPGWGSLVIARFRSLVELDFVCLTPLSARRRMTLGALAPRAGRSLVVGRGRGQGRQVRMKLCVRRWPGPARPDETRRRAVAGPPRPDDTRRRVVARPPRIHGRAFGGGHGPWPSAVQPGERRIQDAFRP